jgi:hypothetical protein
VARVAQSLAAGDTVQPTRGATAALARLADPGAAAWNASGEIRWTGALSVEAVVAASEAETERERTRLNARGST